MFGAGFKIINSGGMFHNSEPILQQNQINDDHDIEEYILETRIQSPYPTLQSESSKSLRRTLELMDVAEDENDNDWNFVPINIISHAKRIIPRKVTKKYIENKLVLTVEM